MNNFIKAIICLSLTFFSLSTGILPKAEATGSHSGTVTANSLNVRSKPATTSAIVGWLPEGSIINVYSTHEGWGETYYKNKKAYVSLKYIKLSDKISFKETKQKTICIPH
ncbi:SH3 domain-containing protein [Planomicrobium sp. CPCC 101079]|uniref:SH3 domain-containing protein n=1 Tax=Planomicrobium sp. CPCC 101079 TaxID=2599618 RepID=UPI0016494B35|nr:SH3 domain-containing protein [Planomicrobium sp. CPCC 101079]